MADKQETSADIIAEMRGNEFDDPHLDRDGIIGARRLARGWADRFEAALKRERGDCAKLREAVRAIWKEVYFYAIEEDKQDFAHLHEAMLEDPPEYKDLRNSFFAIAHLVDTALATPPRNCDVGTAEEQAERWYWRYHVGHLCQSCPLGPRKWSEVDAGTLCFSEWQQMPYEEGGAK